MAEQLPNNKPSIEIQINDELYVALTTEMSTEKVEKSLEILKQFMDIRSTKSSDKNVPTATNSNAAPCTVTNKEGENEL